MIYATEKNATEKDFLSLLEESKNLLLKNIATNKNYQPLDFETFVYETMRNVAKETVFEGTIERTGKFGFPDVLANRYFGVEVKMTKQDKWTSIGNSIFETSRVDDVERIFILFGKFGGNFDARYKAYQDCLPSIKVTHSPRYVIDMELSVNESIFEKIGTDYESFRKDENKVHLIKTYYKKQLKDGEELWWMDESQEKSVAPIIRSFQNLEEKEKRVLLLRV